MAYQRRRRQSHDDDPVAEFISGLLVLYILMMLGLYYTNKGAFWQWFGLSCVFAIVLVFAIIGILKFRLKLKKKKSDAIINDLKQHGLEGDVTSFIDGFGLQKKTGKFWKYDRYSFSWEQLDRFRKILNEKGAKISTDKWEDLIFILKYYINEKEDRFMRDSVSMAPQKFADLSGPAFEDLLVRLYGAMGYSAQKTGQTGDAGCDLVVNMDGERWVIQAKRYSSGVGIAAVQEANTAKALYNCNRSAVVTSSNFTKEAYEAATANKVKLIGGEELEALLLRYLKQNWK